VGVLDEMLVDGKNVARDFDLSAVTAFQAVSEDGLTFKITRDGPRDWTVTAVDSGDTVGAIHRIALSSQFTYSKADTHVASGTQHDLWNAVASLITLPL
jgi:hypothetical protein